MLGLPLLLALPADRHLVELDSLLVVLVCYADHGKLMVLLHSLAVDSLHDANICRQDLCCGTSCCPRLVRIMQVPV